MLASPQPMGSTFQPRISPARLDRTSNKRPLTRDGEKEAIWLPMLQSASKGKDLLEKQLIVLGGTPTQQREFLEHLNPADQRGRNGDRRRGGAGNNAATNLGTEKNIPVSNKYALGYTFQDVLDADHEDVLARVNIYMLTNPSGVFAPLLKPLLTAKTVKETLIVLLLDWSDPFVWARQLRQWVRLLRKVILTLDEETKIELEECMNAWKEKRVGPDALNTSTATATSTTAGTSVSQSADHVNAALGPGEWEDGLGIPMAVVCVRAEEIERLEKDLGWQDDQFDFLQQWLRTILLKHGASLTYTASFDSNNVRPLIHSSMSISSLLKKEVIKHNIIDRDKILVPPNWDSWGKIRILREGFDPEAIGNAWSVEIQDAPEDHPDFTIQNSTENDPQKILENSQQAASAVSMFESSLANPSQSKSSMSLNTGSRRDGVNPTQPMTVSTPLQEFLQSQTVILDKLLEEDRVDKAKAGHRPGYLDTTPSLGVHGGSDRDGGNESPTVRTTGSMSPAKGISASRLTENIVGPYQINVNGIDFDAEEATRRLRERETERNAARSARDATPIRSKSSTGAGAGSLPTAGGVVSGGGGESTPGQDGSKTSNEALHGFFANLIKKGQQGGSTRGSTGSGAPSPRRESPAPDRRKNVTSTAATADQQQQ